jgi:hypothetical protein
VGCVTIYWGANNISVHVSSGCYIDKRDFNTYEDLYFFMVNMTDDVYFNYIKNYLSIDKVVLFKASVFAEILR